MRQVDKKIYEVCSSLVLVRNNRFVLLYDRNKKHYVLPQGHKKKKETLPETALREAREETGYQELFVIRKLGRYKYHFNQGRKTIYKTIHVYLVKVISGKRHQNTQNVNEDFVVRIFTFKDAIKMVRWEQDKKYISLARNFLRT